ncbi:MAG: hypothetical protein VB013_01110 [Anaerolineaceae bacterium]|nr:hypothetical protein [Anaerolineaceae bacterium]
MKKGIVVALLITGILLNSCTLIENGAANSIVTSGTSLPASTKQAVSPTPTHPSAATSQVFPFGAMAEQVYQYEQTQMAKFPVKCNNPQKYLFSPDHNWLAWACPYAYKEDNQTLEIASLRGNDWILQSRNYYTDEFKKDFLEFSPYSEMGILPVNWSKDGKSLYFATRISIDADGPCFFGFGDNGLYKIDVQTGKISTILPPPSSNSRYGYQYAFSPDEKWLVYGFDQTSILNLQTNEVYPIDKGWTRAFTWSQDSSKVVYILDNSNLILYSPETKKVNTLVNEEGWCLNIFPYEDRIRIDLINENDWTTREDEFTYDWTTGIIIQITPTP